MLVVLLPPITRLWHTKAGAKRQKVRGRRAVGITCSGQIPHQSIGMISRAIAGDRWFLINPRNVLPASNNSPAAVLVTSGSTLPSSRRSPPGWAAGAPSPNGVDLPAPIRSGLKLASLRVVAIRPLLLVPTSQRRDHRQPRQAPPFSAMPMRHPFCQFNPLGMGSHASAASIAARCPSGWAAHDARQVDDTTLSPRCRRASGSSA